MKLNLLPKHVAKEASGRTATIIGVLLGVLGVFLAVVMIAISQAALGPAQRDENDARNRAASAKAESDLADADMSSPATLTLVRNVALAQSMEQHNAAYPDLYDRVRDYIPSYYRVTSMSAAPGGPGNCVVTLTGTISTYQQYADLALAMLRIPGAVSYQESGYQLTDSYVPALTPDDQVGRRIRPGETNIPQDPLKRLDYLERNAKLDGYLGVSNFGADADAAKGPMPGASLVTMAVVLVSDPMSQFSADIQTPDPRATLSSGIAAPSAAAAGTSPFGAPGRGQARGGNR